jgi:hypothetical protein
MPLIGFPSSSRGKLFAPERHALVEAHALPDATGLADDDARAVVDEEALVDMRPGVDVDAGLTMGVLGDDAGQQRDVQVVQRVRDPVARDRLDPGVAEDRLVRGSRGGIALVGGLDVRAEPIPDLRQRLEEREGGRAGRRLAVRPKPSLRALEAEAPLDLDLQLAPDAVEEAAEVEGQAPRRGLDVAEVAREEHRPEVLDDTVDHVPGRERLGAGRGLPPTDQVAVRLAEPAHDIGTGRGRRRSRDRHTSRGGAASGS